jgi:hypothetical protein
LQNPPFSVKILLSSEELRMKRISLILLCGLVLNALVAAQTGAPNPGGGGVQVVSDSNTENSRTMVISTRSGEEIEVTVTNLTSLEPHPGEGGTVTGEGGTVTGEGGEGDPIKITIYNYVQRPGAGTPQFPPPEEIQVQTLPPGGIPRVQQPGTIYEVPTRQVPTIPTIHNPPAYQIRPIQIIPGLPDPHSNRVYYLQVGSFTAQEAAARTAQYLIRAGVNVVYERDGYNIRVIVPGVPAAMVHSTIQRLGSLGIGEVWVR